jgi:hypothetical protein
LIIAKATLETLFFKVFTVIFIALQLWIFCLILHSKEKLDTKNEEISLAVCFEQRVKLLCSKSFLAGPLEQQHSAHCIGTNPPMPVVRAVWGLPACDHHCSSQQHAVYSTLRTAVALQQ